MWLLLAATARGEEGNAAPTRTGSFGTLTMSTAEVGRPGQLALAVHTSFTNTTGLLVVGERNVRVDAELALSFTPHPNVELFGAALGFGDRESAPPGLPSGSTTGDRGGGDLLLGGKVARPLGARFAPGVELGIEAPSALGALPASISVWVTLMASANLTPPGRTPVRAHINLGYERDGSRARLDFTGLPEATRQVLMYAYGMGDDRVRASLGLDAALPLARGRVTLQPLLEYHVDVVTAGFDPAFANDFPVNRDQHWVAGGLRAHVESGVAFELGTEIALRPVGYAFGPPLPPYRLLAGASFTLH